MILRASHAVAECGVSSFSVDAFRLYHHRLSLKPIPRGEDIVQRRKAKRLPIVRALSPLQRSEREPTSPEAPEISVQSQLELLEKLTLGREKVEGDRSTIGEQLAKKAEVDADDEVAIPLGKKNPLEYEELTISQKRNIRCQKYLDQVSKRNDAPFFAAMALFVLLPPIVILGVAVATGYVNLLP